MIKHEKKVIIVEVKYHTCSDNYEKLLEICRNFQKKTGHLIFIHSCFEWVVAFLPEGKETRFSLRSDFGSDLKIVRDLYGKYKITDNDTPHSSIYLKTHLIEDIDNYFVFQPTPVGIVYLKGE